MKPVLPILVTVLMQYHQGMVGAPLSLGWFWFGSMVLLLRGICTAMTDANATTWNAFANGEWLFQMKHAAQAEC
eukprot:scaffold5374_cov149-Skeletonema_menzelii.AAC.5